MQVDELVEEAREDLIIGAHLPARLAQAAASGVQGLPRGLRRWAPLDQVLAPRLAPAAQRARIALRRKPGGAPAPTSSRRRGCQADVLGVQRPERGKQAGCIDRPATAAPGLAGLAPIAVVQTTTTLALPHPLQQ